MNLYAIIPSWAPNREVSLVLAEDDAEALETAVFDAAHCAVRSYGSPCAHVYLVARDLPLTGTAQAASAPQEWEWAHPGVERAICDGLEGFSS